jgi:hypothetical protein
MEIALVIGAVLIVLALIWAGVAIYGFRRVVKAQDKMGERFAQHATGFDEDFFANFDSPEPRRVRGREMR